MTTRRISTLLNIGGAVASSLTGAIRSLTGSFGGLGGAIQRLTSLQSTLNARITSLAAAGRNVHTLTGIFNALGQTIDRVKRTQEQLNSAMSRMQANNSARSELQGQLGDALALAAAMAAPVYVAANFEQAIARVGAISRATDEDMARLTASARELGATTEWSASDAAIGMQYLAMSGFDVQEMLDTMPGLLSLATAGAVDLGSASDIAAGVLRGFRLEADEMGRVGDVLVNTFTGSSTSLQGLGDTMRYVAPVATSSGVSLEEVAGAAGILGDNMIRGSDAGTALRAIIARLSGPSDEAREVMRNLGLQTQDTAGNMLPLGTILADLNRRTGSLGNAQRNEIMATLFGLEAMSAATVLVGEAGTGRLTEFTASLSRTGSAAEVAARQANTTIGDWKELQSALEENAIIIGNQLLPVIRVILQDISALGLYVAGLAQRYPNLTRAIVVGTAALVAMRIAYIATSYAMVIFRGVLLSVEIMALNVKAAFQLLTFGIRAMSIALITNPVVAVIVGIAAAALLLYVYWDPISAWFAGLWNDITLLFTYTMQFWKDTIGWSPLELVGPIWEAVKAYYTGLFQFLMIAIEIAWGYFITFFSWTPLGLIIGAFAPVEEFFAAMWERILGYALGALGKMVDAVTAIPNFVSDYFGFGGEPQVDQYGNPLDAGPVDANGNPITGTPTAAPAGGAGLTQALPTLPTFPEMGGGSGRTDGQGQQAPAVPGLPNPAAAGGPQISIVVNPAQGQDERAIADGVFRRVRQQLEEAQQGALYDGAGS